MNIESMVPYMELSLFIIDLIIFITVIYSFNIHRKLINWLYEQLFFYNKNKYKSSWLMRKRNVSWRKLENLLKRKVRKLIQEDMKEKKYNVILLFGIEGGGQIIAGSLSRDLNIPMAVLSGDKRGDFPRNDGSYEIFYDSLSEAIKSQNNLEENAIIIIDDISHKQHTLKKAKKDIIDKTGIKSIKIFAFSRPSEAFCDYAEIDHALYDYDFYEFGKYDNYSPSIYPKTLNFPWPEEIISVKCMDDDNKDFKKLVLFKRTYLKRAIRKFEKCAEKIKKIKDDSKKMKAYAEKIMDAIKNIKREIERCENAEEIMNNVKKIKDDAEEIMKEIERCEKIKDDAEEIMKEIERCEKIKDDAEEIINGIKKIKDDSKKMKAYAEKIMDAIKNIKREIERCENAKEIMNNVKKIKKYAEKIKGEIERYEKISEKFKEKVKKTLDIVQIIKEGKNCKKKSYIRNKIFKNKTNFEKIYHYTYYLSNEVYKESGPPDLILAIDGGGVIVASLMSKFLDVPMIEFPAGRKWENNDMNVHFPRDELIGSFLDEFFKKIDNINDRNKINICIVDDTSKTGETLEKAVKKIRSIYMGNKDLEIHCAVINVEDKAKKILDGMEDIKGYYYVCKSDNIKFPWIDREKEIKIFR